LRRASTRFQARLPFECTNLFEGVLVLRHGTIMQYHAAVDKTGANSGASVLTRR
jgi:hypothetical protein